jgi:hypothetical protein
MWESNIDPGKEGGNWKSGNLKQRVGRDPRDFEGSIPFEVLSFEPFGPSAKKLFDAGAGAAYFPGTLIESG